VSVETIIDGLIGREAGLVNDPNDRGGITKFGITKPTLSEWLGHAATDIDIAALSEDDARRIYSDLYVWGPGFDAIADPVLQELVVDCAVLHGRPTAAHWLQEAAGVPVDGKIGPKTIAAVNASRPLQLYLRICATRWRFMGADVHAKPNQVEFIHGWCNRGAHFLDIVAS
jgi:lysozyme family protein